MKEDLTNELDLYVEKKKGSASLPHSEAADSWSLGELLDAVIMVAS